MAQKCITTKASTRYYLCLTSSWKTTYTERGKSNDSYHSDEQMFWSDLFEVFLQTKGSIPLLKGEGEVVVLLFVHVEEK